MTAGALGWTELQRALAGHRPTWDSLVARHTHQVEVALVARGVRLGDARELIQAAWAELFARTLEGRFTHLELPGLVIHHALLLAKEQRRAARRVGPVAETRGEVTPEDVVGSRHELELVRAELARTSTTARRVFELLHGVPPRTAVEVAEELGLSVQRVRQTLCEVRARLRVALGKDRA